MIFLRLVASLGVAFAVVDSAACSPNGGVDQNGAVTSSTGTGAEPGTGGHGGGAGGGDPSITPPNSDGGAGGLCTADKVVATLEKAPVDVIVVVDTSPSMAPASTAVEDNLNDGLAAVLEANGLDYRVIVLAGYGPGPDLCVGPPLGGAPCDPVPPPVPASTPNFFFYVHATGSQELLPNIISWYSTADQSGAAPAGWSAWVRPEAKKVFLVFSDTSGSSTNPADGAVFDSQLLAADPVQFGTAAARNYVFHSLIGLHENSPATEPFLPADPIVAGTCTGGGYAGYVGAGQSVQQVSILSGGWRFPICEFTGFADVFTHIADDVVETTKLVCDFPVPTAPEGGPIDTDTIVLEYTPGDGASQTFVQVADQAACVIGGFYVQDDAIHLCPKTCEAIQFDQGALGVLYGCDVGFVK